MTVHTLTLKYLDSIVDKTTAHIAVTIGNRPEYVLQAIQSVIRTYYLDFVEGRVYENTRQHNIYGVTLNFYVSPDTFFLSASANPNHFLQFRLSEDSVVCNGLRADITGYDFYDVEQP